MGLRLPYSVQPLRKPSPHLTLLPWETGDRGRHRCNHRLGTRARGGAVIGLRLDLIHADPRIVTMFWDRARYSVLDGRSSVGLLYGTKFGVRA